MHDENRLMTVAQFAELAGISTLELRRVLKSAPVGLSYIVQGKRMVDYRDLMEWLKLNPLEWKLGELN